MLKKLGYLAGECKKHSDAEVLNGALLPKLLEVLSNLCVLVYGSYGTTQT